MSIATKIPPWCHATHSYDLRVRGTSHTVFFETNQSYKLRVRTLSCTLFVWNQCAIPTEVEKDNMYRLYFRARTLLPWHKTSFKRATVISTVLQHFMTIQLHKVSEACQVRHRLVLALHSRETDCQQQDDEEVQLEHGRWFLSPEEQPHKRLLANHKKAVSRLIS